MRKPIVVAGILTGLVLLAGAALPWPGIETEQRLTGPGAVDLVVVHHDRFFGLDRTYSLYAGQHVVVDRSFPLTLCGHRVELGSDSTIIAADRTPDGGAVVRVGARRFELPPSVATPCR